MQYAPREGPLGFGRGTLTDRVGRTWTGVVEQDGDDLVVTLPPGILREYGWLPGQRLNVKGGWDTEGRGIMVMWAAKTPEPDGGPILDRLDVLRGRMKPAKTPSEDIIREARDDEEDAT